MLVQHVKVSKNEDCAIGAGTYHSTRYEKTLPDILVARVVRNPRQDGIVGFISCIPGLHDWFIGLANDQVHGIGYFSNCTKGFL